jgi:hypothetical protein
VCLPIFTGFRPVLIEAEDHIEVRYWRRASTLLAKPTMMSLLALFDLPLLLLAVVFCHAHDHHH